MTVSHDLSRRDFVRIVMTFLGTIMAVVIGLPAIAYLFSPSVKAKESDAWIPAGKIDSYPVGVPTLFSFTRTTLNGWEKTVNSFGAYLKDRRCHGSSFLQYLYPFELSGELDTGYPAIYMSLP